MADETSESTTPSPQIDMNDFAKAIGRSVSQAIEENHPKKVTIGEYMRRENKGRSVLKRDYYENGIHISPRVLSNREIDLLNQVSRSGRYINRLVEVLVRQDGDVQTVYIQYNNQRLEQRFDNAREWKDLEDLLTKVLAAQKLENDEEAELKRERQERVVRASERSERHFGDSKATREAREKAGV